MIEQLNKLPGHSRLWIYQSNRPLTDDEVIKMKGLLDEFVEKWEAHGQPLLGAFQIEYNQFIILAVDESRHGASGCSIDTSVALIRKLESLFDITLLDRSKVAFYIDHQIVILGMKEIKEKLASGEISKEAMVFNNHLDNKESWEQDWKVPVAQSWLSRYL